MVSRVLTTLGMVMVLGRALAFGNSFVDVQNAGDVLGRTPGGEDVEAAFWRGEKGQLALQGQMAGTSGGQPVGEKFEKGPAVPSVSAERVVPLNHPQEASPAGKPDPKDIPVPGGGNWPKDRKGGINWGEVASWIWGMPILLAAAGVWVATLVGIVAGAASGGFGGAIGGGLATFILALALYLGASMTYMLGSMLVMGLGVAIVELAKFILKKLKGIG